MKFANRSGAALAATAAVLFLTGAALARAAHAEEAKGHCVGANSCKGQSACKSASNACKGQNACKGKGFTSTTESECKKIEGARFERGM